MKDFYISFNIDDVTFVVTSISNQMITTPFPKHCHSKDSYEIHYIPYGYGTVIIDETSYDIQPNTLYITGPGIMHEQISNAREPMSEYGIIFDVFYKNVNIKKDSIVHTFLSNPFWFGQDGQNLVIIFKQIFEELANRFTGYMHNVESLCKMAVILVSRNYINSSCSFHISPEFSLNTTRNVIIENAFLYDYNTITMDSLAKRIGLSKRQTERLLKEQYGKTFLQKRTEARMSTALLLLESKKTITQISESLGYSSCEHFSNAFKQYFGKSPRNYVGFIK